MSGELVPAVEVVRGRPERHGGLGARSHRKASAGVRHASAASVVRLNSSLPSQPRSSSSAGQPCGRTMWRATDVTSIRPPSEEGCAATPTPPAARTRGRDPERGASRVRDLGLDTEREAMALLRAHLGADKEEDPIVPALPAVATRSERVVVGQQQRVRPGVARGGEQLGHGGGPVRGRGVAMHDGGHVEPVHGHVRPHATSRRRRPAAATRSTPPASPPRTLAVMSVIVSKLSGW